jgi:hypothetical protein
MPADDHRSTGKMIALRTDFAHIQLHMDYGFKTLLNMPEGTPGLWL